MSLAGGRLVVGTDVSLSATPQSDNQAWFDYTDYSHDALRMLRAGITTDLRLNDRVSFLADVRTENGDAIRPYALYVRVRPWTSRAIDLQAGRIPPAFGAFSRRAYGNGNPLIGYPLAYQYLTSVRPDAVPADADELLHMRARGWRPSYTIGSQAVTTGMPLVTAFEWDTGAEVHAAAGNVSGALAITAGTLSDPRVRDDNGGRQISGRLQWQPVVGLTLGGSAARGPYLADAVRERFPGSSAGIQRAFGSDAEYSRDHWLVRSELVVSRWTVPTLSTPLVARSAFVESTYKLRPGLFAAARADTLRFSRIAGRSVVRTWDAPVSRIECGIGVYAQRNVLVRGTFQHNWRDGGQIRSRSVVTMQLQFWL
jgi:hypothetical protein